MSPTGAAEGAREHPGIALGRPRLHLHSTTSTNDRARELALAGAPHGTLVTASLQTAGRGRQGRQWSAPPDSSLLMSLVIRSPHIHPSAAPLPLCAAVAVCDLVGPETRVKWPNDIVLDRPDGGLAKLAGILTEGRPQEGWAVLGIGLNVALRLDELPRELRLTAATLGLSHSAIEPTLERLLRALQSRLTEPPEITLTELRARDALLGREISWAGSSGRAAGIDNEGRLIVQHAEGQRVVLSAGEVHLARCD